MGQLLLLTQMITILSAQEQGDFGGSGREPLSDAKSNTPDTLGARLRHGGQDWSLAAHSLMC